MFVYSKAIQHDIRRYPFQPRRAHGRRDHKGLLGSADIELVVTAPQGTISKAMRKELGYEVARAVFVDLRYTYTATFGKRVHPLLMLLCMQNVANQGNTRAPQHAFLAGLMWAESTLTCGFLFRSSHCSR